VLYLGLNNIIQDGSPNALAVDTASSPTLTGTTGEGWGDFNGSANYVNCTDIEMDGFAHLTISCWISKDAGFATGRIISKDQQGVAGAWLIDLTSAQPRLFLPADGNKTATDPSSIDNEWHHIAGVLDGTAMRLYVDGVNVATNTWDGSLNDSQNEEVVVGSDSDVASPALFFSGQIDEVTILTNSWSDTQATNYYDATTNLFY